MPSIGPIQLEWRWKKWSHTARRIQIAPQQRVVRHCRSAGGFGSRCLALALKQESLELASRWKEHFAPSTHNTWLDHVSPSEFSSRGLTSKTRTTASCDRLKNFSTLSQSPACLPDWRRKSARPF